jgi:hypothetical protein
LGGCSRGPAGRVHSDDPTLSKSSHDVRQVVGGNQASPADDGAALVIEGALVEEVANVAGADAQAAGNVGHGEVGHGLLLMMTANIEPPQE